MLGSENRTRPPPEAKSLGQGYRETSAPSASLVTPPEEAQHYVTAGADPDGLRAPPRNADRTEIRQKSGAARTQDRNG